MKIPALLKATLVTTLLAWMPATSAEGEDPFKEVQITTTKVADGLYMLAGQGGNIAVSAGDDGVFMIDDQFAPLNAKIMAAIGELSDKPVKFVINTHWHPDHTGGNEHMGDSGSVIVAHANVRKRLSVDGFIEFFNMHSTAQDPAGLPVVTFTDGVTFHLNNEEIRVRHAAAAHTDGDAWVYFSKANVLHTGDIYFAGMFPFIDSGSGGSADGYIAAIDSMLAVIDDDTVIIPGHGQISDKAGFAAWRNMLADIRDRVKAMKDKGASLEAIIAEAPTFDYEEQYGNGRISGEAFTELVYNGL